MLRTSHTMFHIIHRTKTGTQPMRVRTKPPHAPNRFAAFVALAQLLLLLMSNLVLAQGGTLTSVTDRTDIALDDLLKLEVSSNQSNAEKPDFSKLDTDFEVLGVNTKREARIANGSVATTTTWEMTLRPKRQGRLVIPSFRSGSTVSDAIAIAVSKAEGSKSLGNELLRVETKVSASQVYVREPFTVTYIGYQDPRVAELEAPRLNKLIDATVRALPVTQYEKVINGKRINVFEAAYLVTPTGDGELEIPSLVRRMKVRDTKSSFRFFGERTENYTTKAAKILVRPIPPEWPTGVEWFPAKSVTITRNFDQPLDRYALGDPINMEIKISAAGNIAEAIPAIDLPRLVENLPGVRLFPEKPKLSGLPDQPGRPLSGVRTESTVLIVNDPIVNSLPGFSLAWWDVENNELKYASLADEAISVIGSTPNSNGMTSQADSTTLSDSAGGTFSEPAVLGTSSEKPTGRSLLSLFSTFFLCIVSALSAWLFLQNRNLRRELSLAKANAADGPYSNGGANEALKSRVALFDSAKTKLDWHFAQYVESKSGKSTANYANILIDTVTKASGQSLYALSDVSELLANRSADGSEADQKLSDALRKLDASQYSRKEISQKADKASQKYASASEDFDKSAHAIIIGGLKDYLHESSASSALARLYL